MFESAHKLVGHASVRARLEGDFAAGKLAHAYLISGHKGIGKSMLAKQFAAHILSSEGDLFGGVQQRIDAGGHAGLKIIQREIDKKTGELKRDIVVEQAREISDFFSMTAGEGRYRVIIIDAVDEMNVSASNAILKILEEPPANCVLLLVTHHLGRLLPTIRSRCQLLKCAPLSGSEYMAVMRRVLSDVDEDTLRRLGGICEYSPATAIAYYEQGAHVFYEQLESFFDRLPAIDPAEVWQIAKWVGSGATAKANWPLFSALMLELLARQAKAPRPLEEARFWAEKWAEAKEIFNATEKLSLDYGAVIISYLHSIPAKQPYALVA